MRLGFVGTLLSVMVAHAAVAAPQLSSQPQLDVKWKKGLNVEVCSAKAQRCLDVSMPSSVGKIERIIQKEFVAGSPASWLAVGKKNVNLCTVKYEHPTAICARISQHADGMILAVVPSTDGKGLRWTIKKKGERPKGYPDTLNLLSSFSKAQTYLGRKRMGDLTKQAGMGSTDAADMHTDLVDAGGGCYEDAWGDITCDGGGGGGGGGGGDEGGGGGGGDDQIPIFIPPPPPPPPVIDPDIPVVIVTPPPPPPPPATDEPWYCNWFGIGCSAQQPSEPAPPPPPPPPPVTTPAPPPPPPGPTPEECRDIEHECLGEAIDLYSTNPESLPGTGTDWNGRMRRYTRECAQAFGCDYF